MYKVLIDGERCKGCYLCLSVCSKEIIKQTPKLNKKGFYIVEIKDMEKCLGCQKCALICPEGAIEIYGDD